MNTANKTISKLFLFFILVSSSLSAQVIVDCATEENNEWRNLVKTTVPQLSPVQNQKTSIITVPYQIHLVLQSNGTGVVTLQDVQNELDSANFFYANANMQFTECMPAEVIYDDSLYFFETNPEQQVMLSQHYTAGVLNIYVHGSVLKNGSYVCGYAPYPPSQDYVFISSTCATNGSTIAHEIGHYFGVMHTHGGSSNELVNGSNCTLEGDLLCDTPADPTLSNSVVNTSCQYTGTAVDANGTPYTPDVNNVMSYSRKSCRTSFTSLQYALISSTQQNYRNYLSCSISGIESANENFSLIVFPNPGNESVVFNLPGINGSVDISLYDLSGKVMLQQTFTSGNVKLNTSKLADGVYFYSVKTEAQVFCGRWIKH